MLISSTIVEGDCLFVYYCQQNTQQLSLNTILSSLLTLSLSLFPRPLFLSRARLPQPQYHSAIILGTKYTAEEALAAQIINEVCPMDQLLDRAIAAGQRLSGEDGLDRRTLTAIKRDTYRDACKALQEPTRFYSNL